MPTPLLDWPNGVEAARRVGVTPQGWTSRRRREGAAHPPYVAIGREVRYDPEALDRYIASWRDGRRCA